MIPLYIRPIAADYTECISFDDFLCNKKKNYHTSSLAGANKPMMLVESIRRRRFSEMFSGLPINFRQVGCLMDIYVAQKILQCENKIGSIKK